MQISARVPANAELRLPNKWPRRVRSAVVHAVSIAQTSLTLARGWAANSVNARIRLKTENGRICQEVGLLREEMRIKDSRMLQITAQRRPHYPPVERLATPKYLIIDRGPQFDAHAFHRWAKKSGLKLRFGAVGRHGSIAVVERFIRTLKNEAMRRILVHFRNASFRREVSLFLTWYNVYRPHTTLGVRTPDEVYFGRQPACRSPRFEPRPRWPRRSPCAAPHALIRARPGVPVEMAISYHAERQHLPIVALRRAA